MLVNENGQAFRGPAGAWVGVGVWVWEGGGGGGEGEEGDPADARETARRGWRWGRSTQGGRNKGLQRFFVWREEARDGLWPSCVSPGKQAATIKSFVLHWFFSLSIHRLHSWGSLQSPRSSPHPLYRPDHLSPPTHPFPHPLSFLITLSPILSQPHPATLHYVCVKNISSLIR